MAMTEEAWLSSINAPHMLLESPGGMTDRQYRLFACACLRQVWHLLEDARSRTAVEAVESFCDGKVKAQAMAGACVASRFYIDGRRNDGNAARAVAQLCATNPSSDCHLVVYYCAIALGREAEARVASKNRLVRTKYRTVAHDNALANMSDLLRDIFDPFPKFIPPMPPELLFKGARYATMVNMAKDAYWNRHPTLGTLDNARLVVLADYLEEYGCVGEKCRSCEWWGDGHYHVNGNKQCRLHHARLGRGVSKVTCDCKPEDCTVCKGGRLQPHPLIEHLRSPAPHVRGCWAVDHLRKG